MNRIFTPIGQALCLGLAFTLVSIATTQSTTAADPSKPIAPSLPVGAHPDTPTAASEKAVTTTLANNATQGTPQPASAAASAPTPASVSVPTLASAPTPASVPVPAVVPPAAANLAATPTPSAATLTPQSPSNPATIPQVEPTLFTTIPQNGFVYLDQVMKATAHFTHNEGLAAFASASLIPVKPTDDYASVCLQKTKMGIFRVHSKNPAAMGIVTAKADLTAFSSLFSLDRLTTFNFNVPANLDGTGDITTYHGQVFLRQGDGNAEGDAVCFARYQ